MTIEVMVMKMVVFSFKMFVIRVSYIAMSLFAAPENRNMRKDKFLKDMMSKRSKAQC